MTKILKIEEVRNRNMLSNSRINACKYFFYLWFLGVLHALSLGWVSAMQVCPNIPRRRFPLVHLSIWLPNASSMCNSPTCVHTLVPMSLALVKGECGHRWGESTHSWFACPIWSFCRFGKNLPHVFSFWIEHHFSHLGAQVILLGRSAYSFGMKVVCLRALGSMDTTSRTSIVLLLSK